MENKSGIKAIFVDPSIPLIREVFIPATLDALQDAVGGSIEIAHEFENGDVLYVDEEGLCRAEDAMKGRDDMARAYMFDVGAHQPFAGRGVLVGHEGDDGVHTDVRTTVEELSSIAAFFAPAAVSAGDGTPN